jgi:hypothetical protein
LLDRWSQLHTQTAVGMPRACALRSRSSCDEGTRPMSGVMTSASGLLASRKRSISGLGGSDRSTASSSRARRRRAADPANRRRRISQTTPVGVRVVARRRSPPVASYSGSR